MKELIVGSLELISKIAIIIMIVLGFLGGLSTGKTWNAFIGASIAFVAGVVVFGVIFVLLEINTNIRAIRKHFEDAKEFGDEEADY